MASIDPILSAFPLSQMLTSGRLPGCSQLAAARAYPNLIANCSFDKTPTGAIIGFELFILIGTIVTLWLLTRLKDKIWQRYLLVAAGIFIFQFFTAPMWNNYKLGPWAYVYQDVSWILTAGWATLILATIVLIDKFLPNWSEWRRFGLYLLVLTLLVLMTEAVVVGLEIRSYAPEVLEAFSGYTILGVQVEVFYYVPVFMALVVSFYKYWSLLLDQVPVVPARKRRWLSSLVITVLGVFLFELMIEPMVINSNLPAWSYMYRDVSFLMTGMWVILIWLAIYLVDRLLIQFNLTQRFLCYLCVTGIIALPIEAWLINQGYRIYGPSATANFTGLTTFITHTPVEVAFAIPLYMSLIIAFARYWEIVAGNQR